MSEQLTVVSLGVHVLDVLVRPVEEIPEGQGGALVEQIRATAAGTAGGTALTLAKLGARTRSAGAIGSDPLGDLLVELLGRGGVDTSLLVRRDGVQTSASVLPIRPTGERPAFHVIGANGTYGPDDVAGRGDRRRRPPALRRPRVHGRRGGRRGPVRRARGRRAHVGRRAGRGRPGPARVDRPGAGAPRCPAPQRRSGARVHRRDRPRGGLPRARGPRGGPGRGHLRGRRRLLVDADGRRVCRPSRSTSSTRPAAATPSRRASSSAWGSTARPRRQRDWAARPPAWWPAVWAQITATSTSRRPTRSQGLRPGRGRPRKIDPKVLLG